MILSLSTLLKAFLIGNAFLLQTQLHCPQVPHLRTWGQRKQEQHEAGGDEVDCPTQLAIPYSFDDTLINSEQIGKSTAGTSVITLSSSSALRVRESRNSTRQVEKRETASPPRNSQSNNSICLNSILLLTKYVTKDRIQVITYLPRR